MYRVLAISKALLHGEPFLRFLCIKKQVPKNKAIQMASSVPLVCYDVNSIIELFGDKDLFFYDYRLPSGDSLSSIPFVNVVHKVSSKSFDDEKICEEMLNRYDPTILNSPTEVLNSNMYYKGDWLYCNNIPICIWKPAFKDSNINSHLYCRDGCIVYNLEKSVYILTSDNIRHRQVRLGESFSINLSSLECIRYISKIDKNSVYREKKQYFNRQLREWVSFQENEPVYVLGCKQ